MASLRYNKSGIKNDNYVSPKSAFNVIAPYLNKNDTIYEPFYCDGRAKFFLNELGFDNVIHNDEDFFLNFNLSAQDYVKKI